MQELDSLLRSFELLVKASEQAEHLFSWVYFYTEIKTDVFFFFFFSLKVPKRIRMCAQKKHVISNFIGDKPWLITLPYYHWWHVSGCSQAPGPAVAQATEHLWNSLAWVPCLCQSHQPSRDSPGPQQVISHTLQVAWAEGQHESRGKWPGVPSFSDVIHQLFGLRKKGRQTL